MRPLRLIYHEGYDLKLGRHVFPAMKYRMIRDVLLAEALVTPEQFTEPQPASEDDLRLAHDAAWIRRLRTGTITLAEIVKLEIPYSRTIVEAFVLAAGGTILASQCALEAGMGFNLGGGFHHAFYGHGEGFCAINDIAVAIRRLQSDGLIRRAMVVDCDVHQGNGTAAIFAGDSSVCTFSIHQKNNYPEVKPPSTIDIDLPDETGDAEYLQSLGGRLRPALDSFCPELLIYVAGADPYIHDQLGGLSLSIPGLASRDRLVFDEALRRRIPVTTVLAGGYAGKVDDTVRIHVNTVVAARDALHEHPFGLAS